MRLALTLLGGSLATSAHPALACTPALDGTAQAVLQSPRYAVALRTAPEKIPVGKPFRVELAVCAKDGAPLERLDIDAQMPDHRHGMNYKPKLTSAGPGRYSAESLLFHMGGRWEIVVDVRGAGKTDRLAWTVRVE